MSLGLSEMIDMNIIPIEWRDVLLNAEISQFSGGKSGMKVFKVMMQEAGQTYLLKLATDSRSTTELKYESKVLGLLAGESLAPQMLFTVDDTKKGVSLREFVQGVPINESGLEVQEVVRICSGVMKKIHGLKIDNSALRFHMDQMNDAENHVINGLVDEDDFEEQYKGYSARDLFEMFKNKECKLDERTFTHGDFNYPNIIYNDNEVKVIDWGSAGLGDPYRDIALLIREFDDYDESVNIYELLDTVVEVYGVEKIDKEKIEYFILMDEFF